MKKYGNSIIFRTISVVLACSLLIDSSSFAANSNTVKKNAFTLAPDSRFSRLYDTSGLDAPWRHEEEFTDIFRSDAELMYLGRVVLRAIEIYQDRLDKGRLSAIIEEHFKGTPFNLKRFDWQQIIEENGTFCIHYNEPKTDGIWTLYFYLDPEAEGLTKDTFVVHCPEKKIPVSVSTSTAKVDFHIAGFDLDDLNKGEIDALIGSASDTKRVLLTAEINHSIKERGGMAKASAQYRYALLKLLTYRAITFMDKGDVDVLPESSFDKVMLAHNRKWKTVYMQINAAQRERGSLEDIKVDYENIDFSEIASAVFSGMIEEGVFDDFCEDVQNNDFQPLPGALNLVLVDSQKTDNFNPGIGLYRIASFLSLFGVNVKVVEPEDIKDGIIPELPFKPHVIGSRVTTFSQPDIDNLELFRKKFPDSLLIAGGHEATLSGRIFDIVPGLDAAAVGWGEFALLDLVAESSTRNGRADKDKILGILHAVKGIKDKRGNLTRPKPYTTDDFRVLFRAFNPRLLSERTNSSRNCYVHTSSHCSFNCSFCVSRRFFTSSVDGSQRILMVSPEDVVKSLQRIVKHAPRVTRIEFTDDNFFDDQDRLEQLLDLIEEKRLHERFKFTMETRLDSLDKMPVELLRKMPPLGFDTMFVDLESPSLKVLMDMNKGRRIYEIMPRYREVLRKVKEAGITYLNAFIILFTPKETLEDTFRIIEELTSVMAEDNINPVVSTGMNIFPGTKLAADLSDGAIDAIRFTWETRDEKGRNITGPLTAYPDDEENRRFLDSIYANPHLDMRLKDRAASGKYDRMESMLDETVDDPDLKRFYMDILHGFKKFHFFLLVAAETFINKKYDVPANGENPAEKGILTRIRELEMKRDLWFSGILGNLDDTLPDKGEGPRPVLPRSPPPEEQTGINEEVPYDDRAERAELLDNCFIRYDMAVKERVNPGNRSLTVMYGAAGADVSNCFLSTNATEAFFVSHYGNLRIEDLEKCFGPGRDPRVYCSRYLSEDYKLYKFPYGYANSADIESKAGRIAALAYELYSIGVDLDTVQVSQYAPDDSHRYPVIEFEWRYDGQTAPTKRRIILVDADPLKPGEYKPALKGKSLDIYYQRASNETPLDYYRGEESFINYIYHRMVPGGYFITDDFAFKQDMEGGVYEYAGREFPVDIPVERIPKAEGVVNELVQERYDIDKAVWDPFTVNIGLHYGWHVTVRRKPLEEPAVVSQLDRLVRGKNIMFVSFRLNKEKLDGVSLEVEKWKDILEEDGANVFYYSGETTATGNTRGRTFPPAHFTNPEMAAINERIFSTGVISEEDEKALERIKREIKEDLREYVVTNNITAFVAENIFAFPENLALSEAVVEVANELEVQVIAHSHDFWFERRRFIKNLKPETLTRFRHIAVDAQKLFTIVINSEQPPHLEEEENRHLANLLVAPNVMDFENEPVVDIDRIKRFRETFEISADDIFFLAPVRPVPRKELIRGIDMCARVHQLTGRQVKLMVTHTMATDEGNGYWGKVQRYAEGTEGVQLISPEKVNGNLFGKNKYSLKDAYQACDMVLYPSSWEGWGNALVEGMYYRKPVIVCPYRIYKRDIKPKHVECLEVWSIYDLLVHLPIIGKSIFRPLRDIRFIGQLFCASKKDIERIVQVLEDPEEYRRMTDFNYRVSKRVFSYRKIRDILFTAFKALEDGGPGRIRDGSKASVPDSGQQGRIEVKISEPEQFANNAARIIAERIVSLQEDSDKVVTLALDRGNTMRGILRDLALQRRIDWSRVHVFNLHEFKGVNPADEHAFARFFRDNFLSRVPVPEENIHLINGMDPDIEKYMEEVERLGGIDMVITGIGEDGHLGFNTPPDNSSFASRMREVRLSESLIEEFREVYPDYDLFENPYGYTMGLADIFEAREILLFANNKKKAYAVNRAILGPVTENAPASMIQNHPNVTVLVDREAAYLILPRLQYRGSRGIEGKDNIEYTPDIRKAIDERMILPVRVAGKTPEELKFEKMGQFYDNEHGRMVALEELKYKDRRLKGLNEAVENLQTEDLELLIKTCIVFFEGESEGHYSLSHDQDGKTQIYVNIDAIDDPRSLARVLHHELQEWNHVITSMDSVERYRGWRRRRGEEEIERAIDTFSEEKHRELLGLPPLRGLADMPGDHAEDVVDKIVETVGLPLRERQRGQGPITTDTVSLKDLSQEADNAVRTVFDIRGSGVLSGELNITYCRGIAVYLYIRDCPFVRGANVIDLTAYYDHVDIRELESLRQETGKAVLTMDDQITRPANPYDYLILREDDSVLDIIGQHPVVYSQSHEFFARDMKEKGIPFRKIPIFPGVFHNLHSASKISSKATARYVREGMKVLVIGTGAGVEAKIASETGARVDAVDIKEMSVSNTKFTCSLPEAGKGGELNVFYNDLFDGLGRYDLIVFNMPHLQAEQTDDSPGSANVADYGGVLLKRVAAEIADHLVPTGMAVLVNSDGAILPGEGNVETVLNSGNNIRVRQTGHEERYFGTEPSEMSQSRAFLVERDDQGYLPDWDQRYPAKDETPQDSVMLSEYAPVGADTMGIFSRPGIDHVIKEMRSERQWEKYRRNRERLEGIAAPYECVEGYELVTPVYTRILPYAVRQKKIKTLGEVTDALKPAAERDGHALQEMVSIYDQLIDIQFEILKQSMRDPFLLQVANNYGVDEKGRLMIIDVADLDEQTDISNPLTIFDAVKERLVDHITKAFSGIDDPVTTEHFRRRFERDLTKKAYRAAWEQGIASDISRTKTGDIKEGVSDIEWATRKIDDKGRIYLGAYTADLQGERRHQTAEAIRQDPVPDIVMAHASGAMERALRRSGMTTQDAFLAVDILDMRYCQGMALHKIAKTINDDRRRFGGLVAMLAKGEADTFFVDTTWVNKRIDRWKLILDEASLTDAELKTLSEKWPSLFKPDKELVYVLKLAERGGANYLAVCGEKKMKHLVKALGRERSARERSMFFARAAEIAKIGPNGRIRLSKAALEHAGIKREAELIKKADPGGNVFLEIRASATGAEVPEAKVVEEAIAEEKEKAREFIKALMARAFNNREKGPVILGIDDSWVPKEYRDVQGFQLLLNELEYLTGTRRGGLKNVVVVKGRGTELARLVSKKAEETGATLSNIVMLVNDKIVDDDSFEDLRSDSENKRACMLGVDASDLEASKDDRGKEKFIRIIELLTIGLELGFASDDEADEYIAGAAKKYRHIELLRNPHYPKVFLAIPHAGQVSIASDKERYEAQRKIVTAA